MTDYYDPTGAPATNSLADSATMRAEFTAIQSGISNKLPALTGNGGEIVRINSGATAMESITVAVLAGLLASSSFAIDDATTNGVTNCLTLTHTTTGTPATGIGTGLAFVAETAAGNNETGMVLAAVTTDVTGASEDFDFSIRLMAGGAAVAEVAKFTSSGALNVNTINEYTAASGVTIDSVLLKDAGITATGGGSLTGTWTSLGTVTTMDLNGGTIDGTVIGGASAAAGTFTTLAGTTSVVAASDMTITSGSIVSASGAITFSNENLSGTGTLTFSGGGSLTGTWSNLGTVTTVDINGGTIDGTTQATGTINGSLAVGGSWTAAATWTLPALTLGGTVTSNGQSFSGTIANLGTVTTVDINGGTVDGAIIGGSSAAAGTFTTLNATGGGALTGTWSNLGTVTTVDINGGTLDGVVIGGSSAAAGSFTTLTTTGIASITVSSASPALTITQTGSGRALLVEDSASTDSTPFSVEADGTVLVATAAKIAISSGESPFLQSHGTDSRWGASHSRWSADAQGLGIYIGKSRGATPGTFAIVQSGDELGRITFAGDDGTDLATIGAMIHAAVDGTPGANDMPTRLIFSTTADGASSVTERMRIDSAGNIGLGGAASAGESFRSAKNVTGATTSYAMRHMGTVQSGVTTAYIGSQVVLSTQAASFTLTDAYLFDAAQGTIGASSAVTNQYGFHAASTLTGATNNYGFHGDIAAASNRWNLYMAGTASNYMAGNLGIGSTSLSLVNLKVAANITGGTQAYAVTAEGTIQSGVTNTAQMFSSIPSTAVAAFTLSNLYHFSASVGSFGAGSTVTSQFGFHAGAGLTGATNNYGFYGNIAATANRWNLYMAGTAENYMAGALGIGSTSLTGYKLRIAGNLTGDTVPFGVLAEPAIQSDVTNIARMFATTPTTAAAAFTLNTLVHFAALQGSIGGGSAITNQYGFHAQSTLTGATNNYGFYSDIGTAANRYNFYANGTAPNYFAGVTGIGIAASSTATLTLAASTTGVASIRLSHGSAPSSPVDGDMWTTTAGAFIRINGVTMTFTLT